MSPEEVRACLRAELLHGVALSLSSVGHGKVDQALLLDLYDQGVIALELHKGTGGKNSKALAEAKLRLAEMRAEWGG